MKKLLLLVIALPGLIGFSQPTWSDDVAEIVYNNCTSCHHPDGIAPFSMLDYATTSTWASAIYADVNAGIMPPWTADSSFQHYYDERLLTAYERTTILDWVSGGTLAGDLGTAPPPPVYNGAQILPGVPDLTIQMDPYMSQATPTSDDYVCISIPSGLTENRKLKAMEVIPGNQAIVHHCLVFHNASGTYPTDTTSHGCTGPSGPDDLLGGYAPGTKPTIYPSGDMWQSGIELSAGSNIILAMHYPEGSYGLWDSTKVNLYFYEEPVAAFRDVYAYPLIANTSFTIPADEIDTLEETFGMFTDWTFISALPHQHLLGKSIETYGLSGGDTVPMVRIPKWDFDWQDIFYFEYLLPLYSGDDLYGRGIYDNTASNPHNPNDPPEDVSYGLNTSDEMFLIYYHFMNYQSGDEYISTDSLNTIFMSNEYAKLEDEGPDNVKVFPNPFDDNTTIEYALDRASFVSLYIYDTQGRIVRKLLREHQAAGRQTVIWDGKTDAATEVRSGMYYYSMMIDGVSYSGRVFKK